ncbi:MAG: hypothetical protein IPK70_06930 [Flavobacteriales bacterium]|nr:hypothetical protein [Flavobacteriales bacterium]
MRQLLPLALFAMLWTACGTSPSPATDAAPDKPPTDSMSIHYSDLVLKLMGAWTDSVSEPGALVHEIWRRTDDAFYSGLGFVMVEKDTVFIEHIALAYDSAGHVSYNVRVPSQNEGGTVRFPLTSCIGDSMVFENPAHDFPQRIAYALQANGDWIARVSGQGKDGAMRGFSYRFKRVALDRP